MRNPLLMGACVVLCSFGWMLSRVSETSPSTSNREAGGRSAGLASPQGSSTARSGGSSPSVLVRVCSSLERRPIVGAIVRACSPVAPDGDPIAFVTNCTGEAMVETNGSADYLVEAPGYLSWKGALSSAEPASTVMLQGGAAITVRSEVGILPLATTVLAVPLVGGRACAVASGRSHGNGGMIIDGLRPNGLYCVTISAPGIHFSEVGPVIAGWPMPTEVTVAWSTAPGHEVEIRGIQEIDCELLRVSSRGSTGETPGSRVRWDAKRAAGVGHLQRVDGAGQREMEIIIRGPLGVLLAEQPCQEPREGAMAMHLTLDRYTIELQVPFGSDVPQEGAVVWRTDEESGAESIGASHRLTMLRGRIQKASFVDLQWGHLFVSRLQLPSRGPVTLARSEMGDIRVLDAGTEVLSLASLRSGASFELSGAAGLGLRYARVAEGAYRLMRGSAPIGPPVHVYANDTTVVSMSAIHNRCGLDVWFGASGFAPDEEATVALFQTAQARRFLKQTSARCSQGSARVTGLPEGEVRVHVSVASKGLAVGHAVLALDQTTRIDLGEWMPRRRLTVAIRDDNGMPCDGLELDMTMHPEGLMPRQRLVANEAGFAQVDFAGGGRLTVGTPRGMWVADVSATQTEVLLSTAGDNGPNVVVACRGWWENKVKAVGALIRGGNLRFIPGKRTPGGYRLQTGACYVIVVALLDGSVVFASPPRTGSTIVLEDAPATTIVECVAATGEAAGAVIPMLTEVDEVPLDGTVFASSLVERAPTPWRFRIHHSAKLTIVVDGVARHGGVVTRSKPTRLEPSGVDARVVLLPMRQS